MKSHKKKKPSSNASLQSRLSELEEKASQMGIIIHYDRLEAAGLKLKGGICRISGEYHLFIDRRKSITEKISFLNDFFSRPIPEDIPIADKGRINLSQQ